MARQHLSGRRSPLTTDKPGCGARSTRGAAAVVNAAHSSVRGAASSLIAAVQSVRVSREGLEGAVASVARTGHATSARPSDSVEEKQEVGTSSSPVRLRRGGLFACGRGETRRHLVRPAPSAGPHLRDGGQIGLEVRVLMTPPRAGRDPRCRLRLLHPSLGVQLAVPLTVLVFAELPQWRRTTRCTKQRVTKLACRAEPGRPLANPVPVFFCKAGDRPVGWAEIRCAVNMGLVEDGAD